ncbi:MAG TPA: SpoIIE family protein phosphatase [Phycisphaerales bacterium]|nr:SpoIIE family protein phosphatase [Phycisphaerales bacterium]
MALPRLWQSLRRYLRDTPLLPAKPGPEAWMFLVGIFFTFTLIGTVSAMTWVRVTPNAAWMITSALLGGCFATGYAAAVMYRRWWLILVTLAMQAFFVPDLIWPWIVEHGWVRMHWVIDESDVVSKSGVQRANDVRSLGMVLTIAGLALGQIFITAFVRHIADKRARDRAELELAQRLHASLVPPMNVTVSGAVVVGRSIASSELGGDLLDIMQRHDSADIVVADVSGHGVKAGVGMAMVKGAVRMRLADATDLGAMATDLNAMLCQTLESGMFVTMAAVRVRNRRIELVGAGHVPTLWWREDENRVERIESDALPLGVELSERVPVRALAVQAGDILVLTTDGLMETMNASGKQLGLAAIERALLQSAKQGPREIMESLFAVAQQHGPGGDDRTVVVIQFT